MLAIHGRKNDTAEAAALAAEPVRTESLGRMAAGIAHDLNGMLAGISATAGMLAHGADVADARALHGIVDAAMRASLLMRQLMMFARQESLSPAPMDMAALVAAMAPVLGQLRQALEPAPCVADRLALERVLVNLVTNAREAGAQTVRVETGILPADALPADAPFVPRCDHARLAVADDGPGIAPEIAARIFEPYFSTRPDGHGLGLSTAYGLVKQSGGFLLHDSGPLGGARFTILLPRG